MSSKNAQAEHTPEFYRRRYLELKARGLAANTRRAARSLDESPRTIPPALTISQETIPAGWYWPARLTRGATLRILNHEATPGVSVLLWNAADASERFNYADTVKLQWTVRLGRGKLLFSDMGRVMASITGDTGGMHDCLAGGSTPESNARNYSAGPPGALRNTRDNFLLAAAKHGLGPRDVSGCIILFAPVITDDAGRLSWQDGMLKKGDYVDLRAEMDLLVAVSNCPHPLSPGAKWNARDVQAILWISPPSKEADFCRTTSEEAIRGFENTDSFLGARAIP